MVTVRVANTGSDPVQLIAIRAEGPPGVTATVEPSSLDSLAANSSVLAKVTVQGAPESRPAQLLVIATGRSGAGSTAALTSIDLVLGDPVASLTLSGNTRLTDSSPADLVAVVTNSDELPVEVSMRASAGENTVRLTTERGDLAGAAPNVPLTMTVPPRQARVVLVQVQAHRPIRRGSTALVVTATTRTPHGTSPVEVSASRDLDVALSADVLPGLLGVGSVVVIPGLLAIWAALTVLHRERRQLGLTTPNAGSQMWENKLWLLAAAAVSLLAALLYSAAGFADLLDTYSLSDVAAVSVVSGFIGAAIAGILVWWHRRKVPAITPTSAPLAVLRAAQRADGKVSRLVYEAPDGKRGLLVHLDRDAAVLAPPIQYTEIDIESLIQDERLGEAVIGIVKTTDGEHRLRFRQDDGYVDGPRAVVGGAPVSSTRERILQYVDEF
jgi:hypothetical protein